MNLHLIWAALLGAVLGSLADWLFAGILFHDRYHRTPDTWRQGGEGTRIAASMALALVTAGAFVALASKLGQTDMRGALKLAAMIWLVAPLPMLITNALFIRVDNRVTASHAVGWLVKLLAIGAATAWLI